MIRRVIIADDLTGALDAAAVLADSGLSVRATTGLGGLEAALRTDTDILSVSTNTREMPAAAAAARLAGIARMLAARGRPPLFKKIDSRLKGHIALETAPLLGLGHTRILAVPAISEFGRMTRDGKLFGSGIREPLDVAAAFAGLGVPVDVPDVSDTDDIARAVAGASAATLLVGARSLAAALVPGRTTRTHTVPQPLLMIVGSRDPITLAQIRKLESSGATDYRMLHFRPDGDAAALRGFAREAAEEAARGAAQTIFCCGGETAGSMLDALGVEHLQVLGELLPGVPVSRLRAAGRDLQLVTKSGGFGNEELLTDLVALARPSTSAVAFRRR